MSRLTLPQARAIANAWDAGVITVWDAGKWTFKLMPSVPGGTGLLTISDSKDWQLSFLVSLVQVSGPVLSIYGMGEDDFIISFTGGGEE